MATNMPNVFIINIQPENWEACIRGHIFGLRKGARHPLFARDDLFLVRKTMASWAYGHLSEKKNPLSLASCPGLMPSILTCSGLNR